MSAASCAGALVEDLARLVESNTAEDDRVATNRRCKPAAELIKEISRAHPTTLKPAH